MAPQKRLDPFRSRSKTLKAINDFQSRMLRAEPGHFNFTESDVPEPEANECHENTAPPKALATQTLNYSEPEPVTAQITKKLVEKLNDSSALSEHGGELPDNITNNECHVSKPEANKWHDDTAAPKVLETLTLNGIEPKSETPQATKKFIEKPNDSALPSHAGNPPYFTEQQYTKKPTDQEGDTDSITSNFTYDCLNLEAREDYNDNLSDQDSSYFSKKLEGVVSKDVMLGSSISFKCDDDLQITSDAAGSSLGDDQVYPHYQTQNHKNSNQNLSPSKKLQSDIEEKPDNLSEKSDNDSLPRHNVTKPPRAKIEILEDCNLVLDPVTGYFCRSLGEERDVNSIQDTDTSVALETNEQNILELNAQQMPETVSRRKRKRKELNPFLKSCMDFRDEKENEDFSVGSSDEWSAKETAEDSSGSDKPRKNKKKKKKTNDVKREVINIKKTKKLNVLKIRKHKKDKGESYETSKGKIVESKSMKPNPCLDGKCKRSCKDITEERRQNLFKFYWDLSVQRRKDWLLRCAQRIPIKRKKTSQNISRRTVTYEYFLNNGEDYIQICQNLLLKTLDVSQRQLLYVLSNETEEMSQIDQRRSNVPIKYNEQVVDYVKKYLESLPAVPSHYCRPNTNKVYLPQEFKNISNLYQLYLKRGREDKQPQLISEKIFRNIFTGEYNIGFHVPKKDKCVFCTKFQNLKSSSIEEEGGFENETRDVEEEVKKIEMEAKKMEEHIEEKNASYARFKLHQTMNDPETLTTSFDMQKVLNTPHGESMLLYYSRKYAMYNLTFYESGTQNVTCLLPVGRNRG